MTLFAPPTVRVGCGCQWCWCQGCWCWCGEVGLLLPGFQAPLFSAPLRAPAAQLRSYLFIWCHGAGRPRCVELGAGCGLAGLAAAHLGAASVVFTDHDAGTLGLIRDNIALQEFPPPPPGAEGVETPGEGEGGGEAGKRGAGSAGRFVACPLAWGETHASDWPGELVAELSVASAAAAAAAVGNAVEPPAPAAGFDLVLASDVIYDSGVVGPLLWTVRALLASERPAKAFLAASFTLEHGTDALVESHLSALGLRWELLFDNLPTGGCRMHEIRLV